MRELKSNSKTQTSTGINIITFILSIMAGWVDTIGLELFLKENSAFMTGRVRALGLHMFNSDLKLFLRIGLVILAFIAGAFISTIVTKRTGLKGGLICTGILIVISSLPITFRHIGVFFLPMAMGCQNAATSLTPINRTTHLTGPITDFGINLAKRNWNKVMFWGLRLIGFPLGLLIGYTLVNMVKNYTINISIILIIPAIIIMLTGIIQEKILNVPLLD